jgi:hypothetical protein
MSRIFGSLLVRNCERERLKKTSTISRPLSQRPTLFHSSRLQLRIVRVRNRVGSFVIRDRCFFVFRFIFPFIFCFVCLG